MGGEDYKKLVSTLASKIESDVSQALQEITISLHESNVANGTSDANGFKFKKDEMSDFVGELMVEVYFELDKRLLS
ncbi:hypothetical protein K5E_25450 [Enterococcus thailandicus]|uniref:hypothetical protein n=1 Tax=Enterococcus thailandicus TaxID=417368 RepID=UPI00244D84F3|nr:hypothetical protein [Enterococcus thailandicus]GMC10406.1 hypothetical protein K5E_25450 [Enterococcus thailandicus]